ncbi:MAG: hypothetical protein AAGA56_25770 [Myxococcota bacterium]
MREPTWNGRADTTLRVLGATCGSLGVVVLLSALLVRWLPVAADAAITIGVALFLPAWASLLVVGMLPARAPRTWLGFLSAAVLLGVGLWWSGPL